MIKKEQLVIDAVHDKVNKEDIYLIWIMKKMLTDLDPYLFPMDWRFSRSDWFCMFIVNKEEKSLLKESKLSNFFLNYYQNSQSMFNWRVLEYELSNEYTLFIYCIWKQKNEINRVIKQNLWTLKSVFRDENLKVFQQKILDVFWLYWCCTIFQMIFFYLSTLYAFELFSDWSIQKDLWLCWEWDVTIDISILEKIIKDWKERFQEKIDLLYLLFSNINKRKIEYKNFDDFLKFSFYCIRYLNKTNEDINQKIDWEFKTYTLKNYYLCAYIFTQYFDDYVYWWSKELFNFYDTESLAHTEDMYWKFVWKRVIKTYKNYDLKELKRLLLLVDQKLYKMYK